MFAITTGGSNIKTGYGQRPSSSRHWLDAICARRLTTLALLLASLIPAMAATTWPAGTNTANQTFFGNNNFLGNLKQQGVNVLTNLSGAPDASTFNAATASVASNLVGSMNASNIITETPFSRPRLSFVSKIVTNIDMASLTNWSATHSTVALDTTNFLCSTGAVNLVTAGDGNRFSMLTKTFNPSVDLSSTHGLFQYYVFSGTPATINDYTNLDQILVKVTDTNGASLTYNIGVYQLGLTLHTGWNTANLHPYINSAGTNAAGFLWNVVTQIQFQTAIISPYTNKVSVTFGRCSWFAKPSTPGVVLIGFDGGYTNQFLAGGEAAKRGFQSTFFVDSTTVASGGVSDTSRMSLKQVQQLKQSGHCIANYPISGADGVARYWGSKTTKQKQQDVLANAYWMVSNGFGDGSRIVSAPGGSVSEDDVNLILEGCVDVLTGMPNSGNCQRPSTMWDVRWSPYSVGPQGANTARFQCIDAVANSGGICVFIFHQCDGQSSDITWANYIALLDYLVPLVNTGAIVVRTFNDLSYGNIRAW